MREIICMDLNNLIKKNGVAECWYLKVLSSSGDLIINETLVAIFTNYKTIISYISQTY